MKVYIKKKIEGILDEFLRFKSFRDYICYKSNSHNMCKKTFKYIGTDDAFFINDNMISTIEEVNRDYILNDLRPTDTVLDIGACIGGFTLKVCKRVKHVYAIEPFLTDRLKENIELNKVKNVTILPLALGDGEQIIKWGEETKILNCISLSEIIKQCGSNIDFLKCDCEGGEWSIKPHEIQGIRRIEMEVHNFDGKYNFNDYLKLLSEAGFKYTFKIHKETDMIIHAIRETR